MRYRGRELDAVALWSEYVDFPANADFSSRWSPLVYCPDPGHFNSRTPAFAINLEIPIVKCHADCGISGSYEWAITRITGCSMKEAAAIVRRHLSIRPGSPRRQRFPQKKQPEPLPATTLSSYSYLPPSALAYLEERGFSGNIIAKFELGFDRDEERVVIPARDLNRNLRFLIRRGIWPDQYPKYLYDEGASKESLLFGACHVDTGVVGSEGLIVVEGSLDAIKLHQHGLTNAVALLGSFLSGKQISIINLLRPKMIFLMLDRDGPGANVLFRSADKLKRIPLYVCRYPRGKYDPAELTREEAHRSVRNAVSMRKFTHIMKGMEIG